jgi:hypothetical protein
MLLLLASLAFPCTWYVYDDYGDGSTDGIQYGGTFVTGGWRPDGGSIVYDLPELSSATITMRLSNVDERGVSQHDLLEMFSSSGGSFSDGIRDNFLQVKFAGDIYDGYDGRVKLQAGPEWYGTNECGAWTAEFDWDPSGSYDFTISFDSDSAWLDIAGLLSSSIDVAPCQDIGPLSFRTLMVPNDGSYARDPLMDDIIIAGVSVCGEEAVADDGGGSNNGGDSGDGGAGDGGSDGGSDSGDGGGSNDGGGSDSGTDTLAAPVFTSLILRPSAVMVGEPWIASWDISGDMDAAKLCFRQSGEESDSCIKLDGPSGETSISTTEFAPGYYAAWGTASGPGGVSVSTTVILEVTAAASKEKGCATSGSEGAGGLVLVMVMSLVRRREPAACSRRPIR